MTEQHRAPIEDTSGVFTLWRPTPLSGDEIVLTHKVELFVGEADLFEAHCSGAYDAAKALLKDASLVLDGFYRVDGRPFYIRLHGDDGNGAHFLDYIEASHCHIPVGAVTERIVPLAHGEVDPRD